MKAGGAQRDRLALAVHAGVHDLSRNDQRLAGIHRRHDPALDVRQGVDEDRRAGARRIEFMVAQAVPFVRPAPVSSPPRANPPDRSRRLQVQTG
ncbi:MAG: hypothetical protein QN137_00115, partial [Armatimonadota bacterium]|nr:hypothetical protein [Armatimonadota bacterium]